MNSANDEDRARNHRLSPVRHAADHRLQWQHIDTIAQRDAPGWTDHIVAIRRAEFVGAEAEGALQQFATG